MAEPLIERHAPLLTVFDSVHAGAAELARWDGDALECDRPEGADGWPDRPHH